MSGDVNGNVTNVIGDQLHGLMERLFPICRSITGEGVRETLRIIRDHVPIQIVEVPTGIQVFDWTVPKEWNVRDAYVANLTGERVIDFKKNNLHLVGYSVPVKRRMSLTELKQHLFTIPEHPDWIPYRTTYYKENWGFCLSHNQLSGLTDEQYDVCIDSTLKPGSMTYGEYYLEGETIDEVLLTCHVCHPSLCNDNLSGATILTFLAKHLCSAPRRYSYRFLFLPVTIGAITWLCLNEGQVSKIRHGLVLTLLGDSGGFTYKKSRRGDCEVDRVAAHILKARCAEHKILDFSPYGYDERQFCSPGFDLPVGCLMRTPYAEFAEYHTSADDLDFVTPENLSYSFSLTLALIEMLDQNRIFLNLFPKGEPQLGRRGLYQTGGSPLEKEQQMAFLWILNLSDGKHSLLDISEKSHLPFDLIVSASRKLYESGLLSLQKSPSLG